MENTHHLEFGSRRETPSLQQVLFLLVPASPFHSIYGLSGAEQFATPHLPPPRLAV